MSKHTLGKWEIHDQCNGKNIFQIESEYGYAVADVRNYNGSEQNKANAKLIAAAPDLLEFAEEVRRNGDTRLASMAIAAIRKATE